MRIRRLLDRRRRPGAREYDPRRDPRQARFASLLALLWVVQHRAWTPYYLVRYLRFLRLKVQHPEIVTEGLVFLGRGVTLEARPGYGRLILGRWVHIGDLNRIRVHEGTMRIGDKVVLGRDNTINCYLDIEIGAATLISDWVYICDFDHAVADTSIPIKDQGIVKSPVRIGSDVWLGTKVTVTRGVTIGSGSVIAAHAVVTRDIPPMSVAVGVPARVVRNRVAATRLAEESPSAGDMPAVSDAPLSGRRRQGVTAPGPVDGSRLGMPERRGGPGSVVN